MNSNQLGRYRYNMLNGRKYHLAAMQSLGAATPDLEKCIKNQVYSAGYYMAARAIRESYLGPFATSNLCRQGVIKA